MKRSPIRRKTRLRSRTELRRHTGLRRQRRDYTAARTVTRERAAGLCEAQISGVCEVYGCHAHHVLPRSAGGPDTPENLLWLCAACHRAIHDSPAWAYEHGLLASRYCAPKAVDP